MADFDITQILSGVQSIEEAYSRLSDAVEKGLDFSKAKASLEAIAKTFGVTKEVVTALLADLTSLAEKTTILSKAQSTYNDYLQKIKTGVFSELKRNMGDAALGTDAFAAKLIALTPLGLKLTAFPGHFLAIGEAAKTSQFQMTEFLSKSPEALKDFANVLSKVTGQFFTPQMAQQYAARADAVRNLQTGLLMAASASGQFNEALGNLDDMAGGLDRMTTQYNNMVTSAAEKTGQSVEQVANFYNAMLSIPGGAKEMERSMVVAGKQTDVFQTALAVARGTGQDAKVVMQDLGVAIAELGLRGDQSVEFLARLHSVAQSTGTPMEAMRRIVLETSKGFAMLSDSAESTAKITDSVINVMGKMSPALRSVGATTQQTTDIITKMLDGMDKMTTGQKAFLSSSTGGPGGLQGAFAIDQMMATGRQDEVLDKLKQNMMQKVGGGKPLITREQAAADPAAAAQFQKQIMFMMSPAMGGMAKDERSAVKLLAALEKGDASALTGAGEDKQEVLNKTVERGHALQKQSNNLLAIIANNSQGRGGDQSVAVNRLLRATAGDMSGRGRSAINAAESRAAKNSAASPFGPGQDPNKFWEGMTEEAKRKNPLSFAKDLFVGSNDYTETRKVPEGLRKEMGEEPGANLKDKRNFLPLSTLPSNPTTMADRTIQRTQDASREQRARDMMARGQKTEAAKLDVTVSTVCQTCKHTLDKKSAKETKTEIARHTAEQDKISGFMGHSTP